MTEKRQFLRIAKKLCATFVAHIGNSSPYARVVSEADGGGVVKSIKSMPNLDPRSSRCDSLSTLLRMTCPHSRACRFGKMGNAVKTFFSSLLIVFATLFAAPAFADDACRNLLPASFMENSTYDTVTVYGVTRNKAKVLPTENGKVYTLSVNYATTAQAYYYIYKISQDGTISNPIYFIVQQTDTAVTSNKTITLSTPNNEKYIVQFANSGSLTALTLTNYQLEEGSTATTYQPYNPLCATCDGTVKQSPNLYKPSAMSQYTSKGVTISVDEEGLLHLDGSTTETQTIVLSAYTSSFANGYTISANVLSGTITGGASSIYPNSNGNYSPAVYFGTYKTSTYTGKLGAIYITLRTGDTFDNAVIGIQILDGIATSIPTYHPYGSTYCEAFIKIATTAYNTARFSPVVNDLNSTVATIREIVTKTINQTAAIASLQADKQTRPEDACPAGKKCLLVETEENGVIVPHWFPIIEAPEE